MRRETAQSEPSTSSPRCWPKWSTANIQPRKGPQDLPCSPCEDTVRRGRSEGWEERPHQGLNYASTLPPAFPAFRTARNKGVLLKPPCPWYFVVAASADEDTMLTLARPGRSNLPVGLASKPLGKSYATDDSSDGSSLAPCSVPMTGAALLSPVDPRAPSLSFLPPCDEVGPPVLTHPKLTPAGLTRTGSGAASRVSSSPLGRFGELACPRTATAAVPIERHHVPSL